MVDKAGQADINDDELDPIDRAIIEDWRSKGHMRPMSAAESAERVDDASNKLREAFERFDDRFVNKDRRSVVPKDANEGN